MAIPARRDLLPISVFELNYRNTELTGLAPLDAPTPLPLTVAGITRHVDYEPKTSRVTDSWDASSTAVQDNRANGSYNTSIPASSAELDKFTATSLRPNSEENGNHLRDALIMYWQGRGGKSKPAVRGDKRDGGSVVPPPRTQSSDWERKASIPHRVPSTMHDLTIDRASVRFFLLYNVVY
jgi:hypothetical protein